MADLKAVLISTIAEDVEQANALAARIGAATTDRTRLVHDILNPAEGEEVSDETVAKFIAWREQALAKIEEQENAVREYVTANLLPDAAEVDVDALKTEYKSAADKVKTARKFFLTNIPGATEDDLKDVPALKTLRGGTAGGGGTGGKRPRVQSIAYRLNASDPWTEVSDTREDKEGNTVSFTNFTVLAQTLKSVTGTKVEVKDLQASAFAAAGTDDLNSLDGKVFEFVQTVGEANVFVKVQPKATDDE